MTKKELIVKISLLKRRMNLTFLPWKKEIFFDGFWHCPVCDYKTKKLSGLSSHISNRKIIEQVYIEYIGDKVYCKECGNPTKFISINKGYLKYCSDKCTHREKRIRLASKEMKEKREMKLAEYFLDKEKMKKVSEDNREKRIEGLKRYNKNLSPEKKKAYSEKCSMVKIQMIKDGKFKPKVNNVWKGKIIEIDNIKFRSSWEAAFYLLNPGLLYEKVIIPYKFNGKPHNYFVDFVDESKKIIYEIKPIARKNDEINKIKNNVAIEWAFTNGYKYIIIDDSYFIKHLNENNTKNFPKEIKRRMKKIINEKC